MNTEREIQFDKIPRAELRRLLIRFADKQTIEIASHEMLSHRRCIELVNKMKLKHFARWCLIRDELNNYLHLHGSKD